MTKLIKYFIFFCFFAFNSLAYADTPKYRLVDLGLQESDQSAAVAINDNGQVVGSYTMFGNKYYFIWSEQEKITVIDLPETANIRVLNNAGQIAGNYKDSTGKNRGFIWDSSLGFRDLGTLGGGFTLVHDMNDLGQIVGESESAQDSLVDGRPEQHAFLWQNDFMIDLGALTGDLGFIGDRSIATSINNQGQIIGTSNYPIAHKAKLLRTNNRAVIWQDGLIEAVDSDLEPQYGSWAYSINNNGLAVFENNKDGYFAYDLATKNKIEIPYARNLSRNPEITDNGDIFYSGKDYNHHNNIMMADILFLKNKNIEKFSENCDFYEYIYLNNSFDNPKEWRPNSFQGAYDYNNRNCIVGVARNIYGETHGVLLIPISE